MPDLTEQRLRWHALADVAEIKRSVVEAIRLSAQDAIRQRGRFDLVLAGGNTPKAIYQACRQLDTDWSRWHCYFGDERCLPGDHPERNSLMALEAWLAHVPIPAAQIHAIPAERGATEAARAYAKTLEGLGDFDFVLLGLGEDGHTASLFPGHEPGNTAEAPDALPVFNAPKPPSERVSLSAQRLSRARRIAFIVNGEGKRDAIAAWRRPDHLPRIPAATISPLGEVEVFCEKSLLAHSQ